MCADRILITGGCGFVGINLVDYLKKSSDYRICVLDNLSLGRKEYLAGFDVDFVEGDIRDESLVRSVARNADSIIHLAADTRVIDSIANPDLNFDVNVIGTYNLLRAARESNVKHFVFASTGGAIVGDVNPPVNESMAPHPQSPYGASKLSMEGYCSAFAGSYGMKTVSLRFSNVYGPHSYHKGSVVAAFFKRILQGESLIVYGDGTQTRDFVFSEDLCSAIAGSLALETGGEAIQLGSGREVSLNELISAIREVVGRGYQINVIYKPFRAGEVRFNYADISKARKVLRYDPRTAFHEGLEKTWKWFNSKS